MKIGVLADTHVSSIKDLPKKIIRFFNDKKLRKRLEKNVKRAKNALQWDNLIEVFIDNCTGT